jgi:glycosyltransferase involved in cell wall biosynthesis
MSRVIGVTMVRDEADIIATTIRHMLDQCDGVIVADNRSLDGTSEILAELAAEHSGLVVYHDDEVAYDQSRKMTALARIAHEDFGATWIVPFDADEIWCSMWGTLRSFLAGRDDAEFVVTARLFDHVATAADDHRIVDPVGRIRWRRAEPAALPKVACRWRDDLVIEMGNHDATYAEAQRRSSATPLSIRHFPYRSATQVIRKIRNGAEAYAATELPEHFGAHWRGWGRILEESGPEAIVELFHKWHWRQDPTGEVTIDGERQGPLVFSPASDLLSASLQARVAHPSSRR